MTLGIGIAAGAPNVWVASMSVVISGFGNGAAVVCNALFVQGGAPDALRGRVFAVLMSTNVALLTLGMIVAGKLTDTFGGRWVWGAAAAIVAVAAIIGFILARGVRQPAESEAEGSEAESEALAVAAHGAEPH